MSKADHSTTPILSRRAALAGVASTVALPIAAALPAPALAVTTDPIFAAIDAHRQAEAACSACGDLPGGAPDELADRWGEAFRALVRTRPTTPAGLVALTTWAREDSLDGEDDQHRLTATIDDAVRGMSGLEPWSPSPTAGIDPVYAVIERHKALSSAYDTAVNHPGVGDDRPKFAAVNHISDQACTALIDHADMMFAFHPTTSWVSPRCCDTSQRLKNGRCPAGWEESRTNWRVLRRCA
jgi:hypothetical protein